MNYNKFSQLLEELKKAYEECLAYKIATYEVAIKHAPLCLEILVELGYVPQLFNNRIEKRKSETDGVEVFNKDFWANESMIISLHEYLQEEYRSLIEEENNKQSISENMSFENSKKEKEDACA